MKKLDLSLIRVVCAVYESRSVSRAAEALSLTQPAVSSALSRLRELTGNPLFVRSRGGMVPTTLADHLFREFKRGLNIIDGSVSSLSEFDPAVSGRRFRITLTDIGELVFMPPIIDQLKKTAPNVRIETCQVSPEETPRALATGQLELAVGYLPRLKLRGIALFQEQYVCLFRKGHPLIGDTVSKEVFLSCQHVAVSSSFNSHAALGDELAALGLNRDVLHQLSHFATLPSILTKTDLLAAVPSRVARMFALTHELRFLPLPASLPTFTVNAHWDSHFDFDLGHVWLRETVVKVVSQL
jgi:DNA-binding transcriptional LysR family regulator